MKYFYPPFELECLKKNEENLRKIADSLRYKRDGKLDSVFDSMINRYNNYVARGGHAWLIDKPLKLPHGLAENLKDCYKYGIAGLKPHFKYIRNEMSPHVCPMCGSYRTSQIDHVIPKDSHPEFSVYTYNLVPACDCNTLKKDSFKGGHPGERFLHPYYDPVMKHRLAYVHFSGDFDEPIIDVRVMPSHTDCAAVCFHVSKLLGRTALRLVAGQKWANILRNPKSVFVGLNYLPKPVSVKDVEMIINDCREGRDNECGTLNNWDSMIYTGILMYSGAIEFIANRFNDLSCCIDESRRPLTY